MTYTLNQVVMLTPEQEKELRELIKKYGAGKASVQEVAFVEAYYRYFDQYEAVLDKLSAEERTQTEARILENIHSRMDAADDAPVIPLYCRTVFKIAATAVQILMAAGAWLLFNYSGEKQITATVVTQHDVNPGHNGAVLHLSNGQIIVLDSLSDGTIASDKNVSIIKQNGTVTYTGTASEMVYNEITTNKGRQWQLTLPDGTKVWLNAASSIHYPIRFAGNERLVEITGEAYFEVAHNTRQPFRVKTGGQVVEDVGTAFNIYAYSNEGIIKTTLVEGAIKVNGIALSTGQQSRLAGDGKLNVINHADEEEAVAWKNGRIVFHGADITTILHAIERWYDVEVVIEGRLPERKFYMDVPRTAKLSELLHGFDVNNIHYIIDGTNRKLTVRP